MGIHDLHVKSFACEQCANRYICKVSLKRQLKIRPCKQKDCEETFTSRDDLKLQQRVHDGADLKRVHDGAEIKDVAHEQTNDKKYKKTKAKKTFVFHFAQKDSIQNCMHKCKEK